MLFRREEHAHYRSFVYDVAACSHRAIEHIGDEQRKEFAAIHRGHVPRPVDVVTHDGFHHVPAPIKHEQASSLGGSRSAVRRGEKTPHDNKAAA